MFALLGATAVLNWRADPFGHFWEGSLLPGASASTPPCLISDELVGSGSWLPFKEQVVRRRQATTVVIGSSRVLKITSRPGERTFANVGMPGTGADTLPPLFRRLHELRPGPLTVYLGVELFWFNSTWPSSISFGTSWVSDFRYLLARQNIQQSVKTLLRQPSLLVHPWRRYTVGSACVLATTDRVVRGLVDAWRVDGSFEYRFDLVPTSPSRPGGEYERDLVQFTGPYYRDWTAFSEPRLDALDQALALAHEYGWRVVGFAPPYSHRYWRRLETAPQTAERWKQFGELIPPLFEHYSYPFVDARRVGSIPCADSAFEDDGWHPNAACAMRLRTKLDAALAHS